MSNRIRKMLSSLDNPGRLLGLTALAAVLTLSACAYHDGHHGRHHGDAAVELELEYRDNDHRVCCKHHRRDWWADSRHDCYEDGGEVVSHHYCHDG